MDRRCVMKAISATLVSLVFFFVVASPMLAGEIKSVILKVEGMTCNLCVPAVKKALSGMEGVQSVIISFEKKEAHVEYDAGKASVQQMIKTIDGVGYTATISDGSK